MAILRGEEGSVEFETGSGSLATVVGTRSWSLSVTKETLDVTDHGDTFRSFVGSMLAGSGTVELVLRSRRHSAKTFFDDVLKTAILRTQRLSCSVLATLNDADSFTFAGIITDMEITSTVGELVIVTANFITSSTITSNA